MFDLVNRGLAKVARSTALTPFEEERILKMMQDMTVNRSILGGCASRITRPGLSVGIRWKASRLATNEWVLLSGGAGHPEPDTTARRLGRTRPERPAILAHPLRQHYS